MKSKPKLITTLVLAILLIIIIVQNRSDVIFKFLFWDFPIPLLLLVVLMAALGFVLGLFAANRPKKS
ncbi:MAG: DUF1049 domain-containing protein [Candidatus Latescibacterota bacterium]|nr:MAG: DUF1049 domain-containing protein [Candidatus Latescibacterota bacterium]